ncbi:MAG: putative quinol monooxygenase [Gemmatimonadota bacterium]
MSTASIRTFLRMRAREGCEEEFVEVWRRAAQEIRRLPGCVQQDLLADVHDPRTYLIVAEWTEWPALEAFARSEHRDRLTAGLRHLRESAERSTYRVLTTLRGEHSVPEP